MCVGLNNKIKMTATTVNPKAAHHIPSQPTESNSFERIKYPFKFARAIAINTIPYNIGPVLGPNILKQNAGKVESYPPIKPINKTTHIKYKTSEIGETVVNVASKIA